MRSMETGGMRSILRKISQSPIPIKPAGRMNRPHPKICESSWINPPNNRLRFTDRRLKRISNPVKASRIPTTSNFRSADRRCHQDGEAGLGVGWETREVYFGPVRLLRTVCFGDGIGFFFARLVDFFAGMVSNQAYSGSCKFVNDNWRECRFQQRRSQAVGSNHAEY